MSKADIGSVTAAVQEAFAGEGHGLFLIKVCGGMVGAPRGGRSAAVVGDGAGGDSDA